ncbi:hypothetical protein SDC9_168899 [bioreactor metagenome]|uniref:Uncharacterized protein n=1 Tax=bioreactor metagenome TaxID=1076179 RepID=A0A645G6T8_9ZZZZ
MQDELTVALVAHRPHDIDVTAGTGDDAAELGADALQLVLQCDAYGHRPPGLAGSIAQQAYGAEVVLAAAHRQALVILAGEH